MDIIDIFNKVKPPYNNINEAPYKLALEALQNTPVINDWIKTVLHQKEVLATELS